MDNEITLRIRDKDGKLIASLTIQLPEDVRKDFKLSRDYIDGISIEKMMTC